MMIFNTKSANSMRYKLTGRLHGHTGGILSVAMAESGKLLASGGV